MFRRENVVGILLLGLMAVLAGVMATRASPDATSFGAPIFIA